MVDGLIYIQQPAALQDPEMLLRTFHFMAHHGLRLSTTTEYRIEQGFAIAGGGSASRRGTLALFGRNFTQPHAAEALRAMHSLHLLTLLLPELK